MNIKELLVPFLLFSFLFIVILTVILYRIMWIRLDAMIKKNKDEEKNSFSKEESGEPEEEGQKGVKAKALAPFLNNEFKILKKIVRP